MPFFGLFAKKSDQKSELIYQQALAKAQQAMPERFAAPAKTPEERRLRFEVIAVAVCAELAKIPSVQHQEIYDVMFSDFDAALREAGVGDLSVGKQIKKYASAFDGRYAAYLPALQQTSFQALGAALARNHVGTEAEIQKLARTFAPH